MKNDFYFSTKRIEKMIMSKM